MFCYLHLNDLLGDFDAFGLGELGQTFLDLLVGWDDAAQTTAEQVLVEVLDLAGVVLLIPQTAGIRGDFVGQQQRAVGGAAHLNLEVNQLDVDLGEDLDQGLVDLTSQRGDLSQILTGAHVKGHEVIIVDERIMQIVVLQEVLEHRLLERQAFLHAQAGAEVTGGHVTQHDLQREHVHLAYQLAGVIHALDEVAVDAALLEQVEDDGGDALPS